MATGIKHPSRSRRKARARAVLHSIFHNWRDDAPAMLEQRIHEARQLAVTRLFNWQEWKELDAMRDRARSNAKFQQAVKEARHVSPSR
jgi:hypothetical protein